MACLETVRSAKVDMGGQSLTNSSHLGDERLTSLVELLASEPAPAVVVRALVEGYLRHLNATLASLHVVFPDDLIRTVASYGYRKGDMDRFVAIDVAMDLPVPQCVRTNQVLIVPVVEMLERYPLLRGSDGTADALMDEHRELEAVFVPIAGGGRVEGVFSFVGVVDALTNHRDLVALRGMTSALSLWFSAMRDSWQREGIDAPNPDAVPLRWALQCADCRGVAVFAVDGESRNAAHHVRCFCARSDGGRPSCGSARFVGAGI
jgi:hypothetical protein